MSSIQTNISLLSQRLEIMEHNNDAFFVLCMSIIIFLMQCGFAFLEAGSVRSKNTTNILIKNTLDPCFAAIAYWCCGWAFAFGNPSNAFIGYGGFFNYGIPPEQLHQWFFQFCFAATASTIVSGAVAERCQFAAYIVYCFVLTSFLYPILTHWTWADNGWLKNIGGSGVGYKDFAGSGVVHLCGGTCAFAGAVILGPRLGRFNGKELATIRGHSTPYTALGGFILLFGFFAFNGGSEVSISKSRDGVVVSTAIVNTMLSGSWSAVVTLLVRRIANRKWSLLVTINGALAGMVAICASCDSVHSWAASLIGTVAALVQLSLSWLMIRLRIDDPLDAFAVHAGGGLWGVLASPIFHSDSGILNALYEKTKIIEAFESLAWNSIGAAIIILWSGCISFTMFSVLKACKIFRVNKEDEIKGLDISKHGEPAYPTDAYGHGWGPPWDNVVNWYSMAQKMKVQRVEENQVVVKSPVAWRCYEHPELEYLDLNYSDKMRQGSQLPLDDYGSSLRQDMLPSTNQIYNYNAYYNPVYAI